MSEEGLHVHALTLMQIAISLASITVLMRKRCMRVPASRRRPVS